MYFKNNHKYPPLLSDFIAYAYNAINYHIIQFV